MLAEQAVLLEDSPDVFQTEVDCLHGTAVRQIDMKVVLQPTPLKSVGVQYASNLIL